MSHTMKSLRGMGENTLIHIWVFERLLPPLPICTWLRVRTPTLFSLHSISGTLRATPSQRFSIVLKGYSSLHLLLTTHFPQGDVGNTLLQALHGSSQRLSWINSPSLCHWAFWLHLVVSCGRRCWPWAGASGGHWLHSPTAGPWGNPFNPAWERWWVCALDISGLLLSLHQGLVLVVKRACLYFCKCLHFFSSIQMCFFRNK